MAKLSPVFIELGLKGQNKVHVISELVDKLHQKGCLFEKKQYLDAVLERENLLSTYCGHNLSLIHI